MNPEPGSRNPSLLLLGPTGAGKTPLGEELERHGLAGMRCHHFDFGAWLRKADQGEPIHGLGAPELSVVRDALAGGRLLENETFHIAAAILRHFLAVRSASPRDLVVLNGLPRHLGQARDVDALLDVRAVVALECRAETVRDRIRLNSGGDRAGRTDDSTPEIVAKLALYERRTAPLLDHYAGQNVPVLRFDVGIDTQPAAIVRAIAMKGVSPCPGA